MSDLPSVEVVMNATHEEIPLLLNRIQREFIRATTLVEDGVVLFEVLSTFQRERIPSRLSPHEIRRIARVTVFLFISKMQERLRTLEQSFSAEQVQLQGMMNGFVSQLGGEVTDRESENAKHVRETTELLRYLSADDAKDDSSLTDIQQGKVEEFSRQTGFPLQNFCDLNAAALNRRPMTQEKLEAILQKAFPSNVERLRGEFSFRLQSAALAAQGRLELLVQRALTLKISRTELFQSERVCADLLLFQ